MLKMLSLSNCKKASYTFNNCLKFNIGFIYKFQGIQKPQSAINQKQYELFLNDSLGITPANKFKTTYSSLLRSLNAMYKQKLKQILHPLFPPMTVPPKTKFINDNSPISIYYGDCYFAYRANDQKFFLSHSLTPIKQSNRIKRRNLLPFQSNDPNISIQEWKLLGIKQIMDHQAYFKVSLEIFCLSKMKLIMNETKENIKKQDQSQETHQLRIEINGIISRELMNQMDSLIKYKNQKQSKQKLQSINKEFMKKNKYDWRICEMDNCFAQSLKPKQRKKWLGIF